MNLPSHVFFFLVFSHILTGYSSVSAQFLSILWWFFLFHQLPKRPTWRLPRGGHRQVGGRQSGAPRAAPAAPRGDGGGHAAEAPVPGPGMSGLGVLF